MSKKDVTFQYCDEIIDQFEKVCKHPIVEKSSVYYAGVDLGTACIVVAVLDENRRPVARPLSVCGCRPRRYGGRLLWRRSDHS